MRALQYETLSRLVEKPVLQERRHGLRACEFGGERYSQCALRMEKRGWVEVERISPRHNRYRATREGAYRFTMEKLAKSIVTLVMADDEASTADAPFVVRTGRPSVSFRR